MFLLWSDVLSVGLEDIDKQHKKLVDLLNEFYGVSQNNPEHHGNLTAALQGLSAYVDEHFSYEEKMFTEAGYSQAENHKKEHNFYTQEVRNLTESFARGDLSNTDKVATFLKDWLVNHIMVKDKLMASHMQKIRTGAA